MSLYLSNYLSLYHSMHPYIYISIYQRIYLSICHIAYLFIYMKSFTLASECLWYCRTRGNYCCFHAQLTPEICLDWLKSLFSGKNGEKYQKLCVRFENKIHTQYFRSENKTRQTKKQIVPKWSQ